MKLRANDWVAALDVGGTSVKSGPVAGGGRLLESPHTTPIDNRASAETLLAGLARIVRRHTQTLHGTPPAGVALGFPGPFDYQAGVSRISGVAKFESLYGLNIRQGLRRHLQAPHLPVRFRNDAEAAIAGEALYGAGRPFARLIGVTLGTGCGSAFLAGGQPVTDGPGVPPNGWLYPELFAGRQADDVFSIRGLARALHEAGMTGNDIKSAADLARQGDSVARQVFAHFGQNLGLFLQPWVESFGADGVLVQGGIANTFDLFAAELLAGLPVPVVCGRLGPDAALLGAAALFFHP